MQSQGAPITQAVRALLRAMLVQGDPPPGYVDRLLTDGSTEHEQTVREGLRLRARLLSARLRGAHHHRGALGHGAGRGPLTGRLCLHCHTTPSLHSSLQRASDYTFLMCLRDSSPAAVATCIYRTIQRIVLLSS